MELVSRDQYNSSLDSMVLRQTAPIPHNKTSKRLDTEPDLEGTQNYTSAPGVVNALIKPIVKVITADQATGKKLE